MFVCRYAFFWQYGYVMVWMVGWLMAIEKKSSFWLYELFLYNRNNKLSHKCVLYCSPPYLPMFLSAMLSCSYSFETAINLIYMPLKSECPNQQNIRPHVFGIFENFFSKNSFKMLKIRSCGLQHYQMRIFTKMAKSSLFYMVFLYFWAFFRQNHIIC